MPRDADRDQLKALEDYQRERQGDTLYSTLDSPAELRQHVTQHLPRIVQEVHAQLRGTGALEQLGQEIQNIENNSEQRLSQIAGQVVQDQVSLADVISELEDDFDCAMRPRIGDTYRRPSTVAWKENRNELVLPEPLRSQITEVYRRIDSWGDVVESGLNPNLGSVELNSTIAALTIEIPKVVASLAELQKPGRRAG